MSNGLLPTTTLPARAAALGWINTFLTAGHDKERPVLHRTLAIEVYQSLGRRGVHLVATDGTALFRTWVPEEGHEWPELEEAPDQAVVVSDVEGFGLAFMRTLLALTGRDGYELEQLTLETCLEERPEAPALGAELQPRRLVLSACGQCIDLRLFDGAFPDWRRLAFGLEGERVDGLRIAPRLLGLVGKLKGALAVDLEFRGDDRAIGFRAIGESETRGLIMPMRKEPAKPAPAEDDDEGEEAPQPRTRRRPAAPAERLRPEPESSIESVTISAAGQSVTLHRDGHTERNAP